jgi:hypothetical protein
MKPLKNTKSGRNRKLVVGAKEYNDVITLFLSTNDNGSKTIASQLELSMYRVNYILDQYFKQKKMPKNRTMSICLTDIPKDRILKHENGKMYLNISTYDYDQPDQYKNDFSVSLPLTKQEIELKAAGEKINRVFIGNGKIWADREPVMQHITKEEETDLPF